MTKLNPKYLLDSTLFAEHGPVVLGDLHAESVENRLVLQASSYPTIYTSDIPNPRLNLAKSIQLTVSIFSCLNATAAAMDCEISYPIAVRGKNVQWGEEGSSQFLYVKM